jgi:hypothetical protein
MAAATTHEVRFITFLSLDIYALAVATSSDATS